jgi:fatty acid desaturase (delta-4 desaturase)
MCVTTPVTVHTSGSIPARDAAMDVSLRNKSLSVDTLAPNHVCIDGKVFDLDSFDHPGGDSIHVFGGNDVTVLYKMIHPHHGPNQYAQKMKLVGVIDKYRCEYSFDSDFGKEMKREVFQIVRRGQEFGTVGYFFRAFLYIAFFVAVVYRWTFQTGPSYALAVVFGLAKALIGLNVQHDANHGAAAPPGRKNVWINDLLGWGADLIGGCKYLWIQKHWTHHAYTNHAEKDPDAFAAEPFLIFREYPASHPARQWYHKYQTLLFLPIIAGYWLSSVLSLEVAKLQDAGAMSATMKFENDFVARQRKFTVFWRIVHLVIILGPPLRQHGLTATALGQALTVGAAGSLFLGCLFSLSHNFVNAERDPTAVLAPPPPPTDGSDNANTTAPVCWYKAQVETSCTYGGFVSGALTGGLNFQVEHHLFPRMSSAWYPFIAPTVRRVCAKHNVTYTYYPWLWQNMASMMRYLHVTGGNTDAVTKLE